MEVPAHLFFGIWVFIGPIFLSLGFNTLCETELYTSVSPLVISLFENSLKTILLLSLLYALTRGGKQLYFLLRTRSYTWTMFGVISGVISSLYPDIRISSSWFIPCYFCIKMMWLFSLLNHLPIMNSLTLRYPLLLAFFAIPSALIFPRYLIVILPSLNLLLIGREYCTRPPRDIRLAFQMAVETSMFLACQREERLVEMELMFISLYGIALCFIIEHTVVEIESVVCALIARTKEKKLANFIEFAVGLVGALLFQNFFRLTSFNEVVGFLYLAVGWQAILVLFSASYDFGVLNFLLGNVVVGCTVNQLGLRGTTWLAYTASLFLYGLRLRLESLTFVYRPNQQPQVVLW